jgi:GTP-binding protein
LCQIFDLFAALDATNEQLNYPTLYASARQGWAVKNMGDEKKDMTPLFETVLTYGTPPHLRVLYTPTICLF